MNKKIHLQPVSKDDRQTLWHLLQKYLYELSLYYDDIIPDENGIIDTPYFEEYFTEEDRSAYFIYHENERIGFAMINRHSEIGEDPDAAIAEFTILPHWRGRGLGESAAAAVLATKTGLWELKYSPKNRAAKTFWNKVTEQYSPSVHPLGVEDEVLLFRVGEKSNGQ